MFLLHPAILAVVPVLFLYSRNQGQASFTDVLRPAGIALGLALLLLVLLRLALKDWQASAIIVSSVLVLFYTYGRVVEALGGSVAVQVVVGVAWLAALALLCAFAVKRRGRLQKPTAILNTVAVTLAVLTLAGVVLNAGESKPAPRPRETEVAAAASEGERPPVGELPDVYYVILDGYASNESLQEFYGFDNSDFTDALQERGFYVTGSSRSNYLQSRLSLASSLNLEYINYLTEDLGADSRRAGVLNAMIEDNGLERFLRSRGYRYAFFGSNWSGTKSNRNADVSVTEGSWLKGEFMTSLLKTTALRGLVGEEEGLYTREGVLRAFSLIPGIREELDGPAFVFAHIVPPHRPFLFDRDGNPAGGGRGSWRESDRYIEQVMFVNGKTLEMVDEILERSERTPVIIIQADHGPMPVGDPEGIADPTPEEAALRSGILNAVLLPGGEGLLYPAISPVNNFRVVLNELFDTGFAVLDDRVYASSYARPYDFRDITDLVLKQGSPE
ncbi:MAG: LTA synthase family protein [Actinobacteria bacterium]|nr:LTA synthase family protein [Actinomycetota bacterium]MBU1944026.1 LTA synthase family protein [Actinomycetota bacterium]MBU2688522.1 LTA synthase family protein [Actinomycetota bacterium]